MPGDPPDQALIDAREALLDATEALREHLAGAVLVGAQAIYLHTSATATGVVLFTQDADVALLPPLEESPDIEATMRDAGFESGSQPGIWVNGTAQVDLLVPESFAPAEGRRSARLPGHGIASARKVAGMEAVVVDHHVMTIASLNPGSNRRVRVAVAGPGALLVSKVYKLAERADEPGRRRLETKDAFDVYRLLLLPSSALAVPLAGIRQDDRTARVGEFAILKLQELFDSAESLGSRLAGQHVAGTGDPDTVAAAASALAAELLRELDVGPAP